MLLFLLTDKTSNSGYVQKYLLDYIFFRRILYLQFVLCSLYDK